MSEIARTLFTGGGAVILQLMFLGLAGWIGSYFSSAVGKGQLAQLIHLAVLFVAFTIVVKTLFDALKAASQVLGLG
jgi:hypothetical protein